MFKRIIKYLLRLKNVVNETKGLAEKLRIQNSISKGILSSTLRQIDLFKPNTWEFGAFSQNGEDGIIDILLKQLAKPNKYFIEIGASDGIMSNVTLLAVQGRYSGLMIEGSAKVYRELKQNIEYLGVNMAVRPLCCFLTKENINVVIENSLRLDPDVLSLDIDGNDYHILKELLDNGLRPKILVLEYNSVYGSERKVSIPYKDSFNYLEESDLNVYYGVSINGWCSFLQTRGYEFITVESNGVNAFFVDKSCFDSDFLNSICSVRFVDNFYLSQKFLKPSHELFNEIKDKEYIEI